MIFRFINLSLVLLCLSGCQFEGDVKSPRAVGENFCRFIKTETPPAELPTELRKIFTPSLVKEIDIAQNRSDKIARRNPQDKPPLGDGIPYQAYPDDAPICRVGNIVQSGTQFKIDIHHQFISVRDKESNWIDILVVHKFGNQEWRVDNILYGYEPDYKSDLRHALHDAF
jgi:hypothetical protein